MIKSAFTAVFGFRGESKKMKLAHLGFVLATAAAALACGSDDDSGGSGGSAGSSTGGSAGSSSGGSGGGSGGSAGGSTGGSAGSSTGGSAGSGGGSAGSAGGGGTAGGAGSAGQGGGSAGSGPSPCEACVTSKCGSQFSACTGKTACNAIIGCVQKCPSGGGTCADACVTANPGGKTEWDALSSCVGTNCGTLCS